jgi:putative transposase
MNTNEEAALAAEGLLEAPMKPHREHATNNSQTYMVTSSTWERRALFQAEPWARLLVDTLCRYRQSAYLLHEFVIMPDHFHALVTSQTSLEKAVQFIKGGFSYRAKKELGSHMEIWQKGFQDHRIRDASDLAVHVSYIHNNPVKERFCELPDEFPYSSAHGGFELDAVPQGLKPQVLGELVASRLEGVPFQNRISTQVEAKSPSEAAPVQSKLLEGARERRAKTQRPRMIEACRIRTRPELHNAQTN